MAVTISGNTGIAGVDGSASTPAVQGTDTNTGIAFPAADTIGFSTGGSERMRVDSSGNVGIGGTPSTLLHVVNASAKIRIGVDASSQYTDIYRDNSTGYTVYNAAQAASFRGHIWQLGGTEAARIDSSGNFLFNSGYGSVATTYGCRAWVNFAGATGTVAASGNVSSVTRNTTGDYTVNFTSALVDANYAATAMCTQFASAETSAMEIKTGTTPTTSSFTMRASYNSSGAGYFDPAQVHVMVVR